MSRKAYSFPASTLEALDFDFAGINRVVPDIDREDYFRERTAQAKYPAAMLAELLAAGEITRDQYERLRRENT